MKQTFFSISGALGIHRLFAFLNRNRPVILTFHGVTGDKPGHFCNYQGKHLYLPIFEQLMEYLAAHYNTVPLSRIVDWLEGDASVPERAVSITFDDGYRNVLTNAAPVLDRLNIPATLFIVTDFVFGRRMLWPDRLVSGLHMTGKRGVSVEWGDEVWEFSLKNDAEKTEADRKMRSVCKSLPDEERVALVDHIVDRLGVDDKQLQAAWDDHLPLEPGELKLLPAQGVEIGSHTCSHAIVTHLTPDQTQRELEESKRMIEEAAERPCIEFSYPNGALGDFDRRTRRQVVEAGYRCASTTVKRRLTGSQDCYEIPRYILTHNQMTVTEFSAEVSGFPGFLRALKNKVTKRESENT